MDHQLGQQKIQGACVADKPSKVWEEKYTSIRVPFGKYILFQSDLYLTYSLSLSASTQLSFLLVTRKSIQNSGNSGARWQRNRAIPR